MSGVLCVVTTVSRVAELGREKHTNRSSATLSHSSSQRHAHNSAQSPLAHSHALTHTSSLTNQNTTRVQVHLLDARSRRETRTNPPTKRNAKEAKVTVHTTSRVLDTLERPPAALRGCLLLQQSSLQPQGWLLRLCYADEHSEVIEL
jgi:hypothetical protein